MTKKENKKNIRIIAQAFYGNRTATEISIDEIDRFILGCHDSTMEISEKIDRTVLPLPGTNCVLIYNKFREEKSLQYKEEVSQEDNYILKPTAFIPEQGIEIYSKCIVCGITDNGDLTDVPFDDYKVFDYLAM